MSITNYKKKIVSFEHMERIGSVEVHPINLRKTQNLSFSSFKDSKTGIWYGVPVDEDEKGNVVFRRITITGIRFYNLENEEDAKEFHVLKHHESMEGSPFARNPKLRVYNREKEAVMKLKKLQESRSALEVALGLEGIALLDFARVLGINTEQNSVIVVKQLVAEKAVEKPETFMMLYSNSDRNIQQIFKRGLAAGLINYRIDAGYLYRNSMPLGITESSAIIRLMEERALLSNLDIESKNILAKSNESYANTVRDIKMPAPAEKATAELSSHESENKGLEGFGDPADNWEKPNLSTTLQERNSDERTPEQKKADKEAKRKATVAKNKLLEQ